MENVRPTFRAAFLFWLKLGWVSFGGPAGQIALMHEELVERRRWIAEEHFQRALNYCMLLPGPEAQQLATYCGWLLHGRWGGFVAGVLFILPGFLVLAGLSWLSLLYGQLPTVQQIMLGIQAAVIVIVFQAAWKIGRKTLHGYRHVLIAVAAFLALEIGRIPFPLILLVAAAASFLLPPSSKIPVSEQPNPHRAWSPYLRSLVFLTCTFIGIGVGASWVVGRCVAWPSEIAALPTFFTQLALITFGGAYAVLPYLAQQATEVYRWLTPEQMVVGLAFGETTPGPLIMIVAYVGFLAGWPHGVGFAWLGAAAATFYTFLPSFFFIYAGAPLIERWKNLAWLNRLLTGVSAAVVGVIATLGVTFARIVLYPEGQWHWYPLVLVLIGGALLWGARLSVLWLVPLMGFIGWLGHFLFL